MKHVDEGVLIAYADDELAPSDRAAVAEHILACPECRARLEELRTASDRLSRALEALDVAPPTEAARVAVMQRIDARPSGWTARPLVRAAGLVLLVAAGASAAVPGSPVRAWLGSALAPDEQQAETVRAPDTSSGVSIAPVDGRIVIEVLDATPGTMLRVRPVTDAKASVVVPEATTPPQFRTSPGRIEVQGVSGTVLVDVPESADDVQVLVDGAPYVVGKGATLRAAVTAETRDGELTFRLD